MTAHWYLVKENWANVRARQPRYAGIGGDVWPLNNPAYRESRHIHDALMKSRQYVEVGDYDELLCTDRSMAEIYWAEAERRSSGMWLLEVSAASDVDDKVVGFDIGFIHGGYSAIEAERITERLPGPPLNEWGLLATLHEAQEYMELRDQNEALEHLDCIVPLAVRVLRHPGDVKRSQGPLSSPPSS